LAMMMQTSALAAVSTLYAVAYLALLVPAN
jgi:hypothetical protein